MCWLRRHHNNSVPTASSALMGAATGGRSRPCHCASPVRCALGAHVAVLDVVLEGHRPPLCVILPGCQTPLSASSSLGASKNMEMAMKPWSVRVAPINCPFSHRTSGASRRSVVVRPSKGWTNGTSSCSSFRQGSPITAKRYAFGPSAVLIVSVSTLMKSHAADARPATVVHESHLVDAGHGVLEA